MSKKKSKEVNDFQFNDVNRYELDEEWVQTDRMRGYYGNKLANAQLKRDLEKIELKVEQAEIAIKIRHNPEKYGLDRATNDAVDEMVLIKTVKKAKKLAKADHKVTLLYEVIGRLRDRGKCVGDLIYLQGMNYIGKAPKSKKSRSMNRQLQKD